MRTRQILLKIADSISQNSQVILQLPWADIKLCLREELAERQVLYTDEQFSYITQALENKLSLVEQACICLDSESLLHYLQEILFALEFFPDSEHTMSVFCRANFNQACLHHYRQDTVIVLGDSHVNFFSGNETLSFLPIGNGINTCVCNTPYPFTPLHLGPCLAYHANQAKSSCGFREKVEYLTKYFIKPNASIICCLGEIDLRAHVYVQARKQERTYQEIIDDILTQYVAFIRKLQEQGYTVYCWAPIPSQKDICPLDPQFPRIGSEQERNLATAYFNQQLEQMCLTQGIGFLSIFEHLITEDYLTRGEFLSADCCHLSQKALPFATVEWRKISHPRLPDILP